MAVVVNSKVHVGERIGKSLTEQNLNRSSESTPAHFLGHIAVPPKVALG
jgi:hypothetical protein